MRSTTRLAAALMASVVLCAVLLASVATGCTWGGDAEEGDVVMSPENTYENTRTGDRTKSSTDTRTDTSEALHGDPSTVASASATESSPPPTKLTVLYDNRVAQPAPAPGLKADWGFACLVEGYDSTVLFDTGATGYALLSNMDALGIDPDIVEVVVLSHDHGDHTGGLARLLKRNPDVTVYCPASFSQSFTRTIEDAGATVVRLDDPMSPCPGVTVTAPLEKGSITELGLTVDTQQGPVLLTGCAHPGVVNMAEAATDLAGQPLHAVLGGFHLYEYSSARVADVIAELQGLGVSRCGPCHCTGDRAIAQFEEAFGSDFIPMGVGAVVEF